MSAGLKGIFATLAIIAALVLGLPWGLYWYGTSTLPRELVPANRAYPPELRRMYWQTLGGEGEIRIRRLNPVKAVWLAFASKHDPAPAGPADLQALRDVARIRGAAYTQGLPGGRRHLGEIVYEIRISQEWTPTQIVDTALAESWLGRGAKGMDAAAPVYFGAPLSQLSPQEQLSLLALSKAPSFFDPSCRRNRFAERYRFIAGRLGMSADRANVDTALARLQSIPCT